MPSKKASYKPGDEIFSPYRPPTAPPNTKWQVIKRHGEKGYPISWRLIKVESRPPEIPPQPEGSGSLSPKGSGSPEGEARWFPTFAELSQTRHDKGLDDKDDEEGKV